MARRRSRAAQAEEATSLVCAECGDVHAGPHTGENFDPYGDSRPDYKYSQGPCNSRTCLRMQSRKHTEWVRMFSHELGKPEQPESFWRERARGTEVDFEQGMKRQRREFGADTTVKEDWGERERNPRMTSAGVPFEPLDPPIDWDAEE